MKLSELIEAYYDRCRGRYHPVKVVLGDDWYEFFVGELANVSTGANCPVAPYRFLDAEVVHRPGTSGFGFEIGEDQNAD